MAAEGERRSTYLLKTFLIALMVAMAILWSLSRTDAVRMRLNPQLRVEAEIRKNTLEELQARDPALCYRFMATQTLEEQESIHAFSVENTAAFQAAVVQLYRAVNGGMQRRGLADGDLRVDFNDAAREFGAIQGDIEQEFGKAAADAVGHKELPLTPPVSPDVACSARIFQLQAMLKRPQGKAALMIDSVLR